MADEKVVIGIDGGGTHTRVMVCDQTGKVLAYVSRGAASLYKDEAAADNVRGAIRSALEQADKSPGEIAGVAAGIAGLDAEEDLIWVRPLTEVPGLNCPQWHVNDAIVAHYGAFLAQPGIIVISGTGSIVLAIAEDGRPVRNYDFRHYAASAARFLAYDAVYETLAGRTDETDESLIAAMLAHWDVSAVSELYAFARDGFEDDRRSRDLRFGRFAPSVTAAAERGSSVARRVCDRAVDQIVVAIELLSPIFAADAVQVSLTGSVATSRYVSRALDERLRECRRKRFAVVPPQFSPAAGAVLLAMTRLGLPIDEAVAARMQEIRPSTC
ncbi:N-acetylglucosamine kinase [Cohnella sp. REN36]|uniref:N-acetylglucosamine kinase n=1 Tax=Cohnella sp. REN36 TaxID=2887347 RepID=UPI001D14D2C6|nr:BadF/BadG/BcrA/BcrD ATPase family protein [Cohnella sp. REN36]MCC3372636.1 ATPase [Cohnella sp. REN36]